MKKVILIIIGFIIIAGLVWFFGFGLVQKDKKEKLAVEAAEVEIVLEVVSGSVVLRDSQGQEQEIGPGITEAKEGDIIKIQADGLAMLYFSDHTLMRLDENTEVKIEIYSRNGKTLKTAVFLALGRVWSRIERVIEADSLYEVRTLNTVAAVRGTSFGVKRDEGKTEVIVLKDAVEVQAIGPADGKPLDGGFIRVGEEEEVIIIDAVPPTLENPLKAEKLSQKDLEEKWLKFNLEEDGEQLKELKIEEKRKILEEKKQAVKEPTEKVFVQEEAAWQRPALLERIEKMKEPEAKTESQPTEAEIKEPAKAPTKDAISQERPKLSISGFSPKQSIGNGYIDAISVNIFGLGFEGVKNVSLGGVGAENIKIIDGRNLSARFSGKIQYGVYDLVVIRDDGAKATLSRAFEVLKPVGW